MLELELLRHLAMAAVGAAVSAYVVAVLCGYRKD